MAEATTMAGPEYAASLQGEYATTAAGEALTRAAGMQVMAQGQDRFRGLFFTGGLPGAGWNGERPLEATALCNAGPCRLTFAGGPNLVIDSLGLAAQGQNGDGAATTLTKMRRESPTLMQAPPQGAVMLFDGTSLTGWKSALLDSSRYLLPTGTGSTAGAITDSSFGDFFLHLEFRIPFLPDAVGQARGNSGIYFQNRYELQILDSFGIFPADTLEASRQCGAIWEHRRPLVNMSLPPMQWQTYDIEFKAARFAADGTTRISQARITVRHNGVVIHDDYALLAPTLLGLPEGPTPGPHRLQWHGQNVVYRNIWLFTGTSTPTLQPLLPRRGKSRVKPSFQLEAFDPLGRRLSKSPSHLQQLTSIFPAIH
jgi:Domain of Unknown Function (DUF1080)